jgi:hypothetical protein
MDIETKLFLDEIVHQLVKISKDLTFIVEDIAVQRAQQDKILRKEITNDIHKLS